MQTDLTAAVATIHVSPATAGQAWPAPHLCTRRALGRTAHGTPRTGLRAAAGAGRAGQDTQARKYCGGLG